MDYFIIQQDQELANTGKVAKMLNWQNALWEDSMIRRLAAVPIQTKAIYVAPDADNEFPDFFQEPIVLIERKFKQVVEMYQKNSLAHPVVLIDKGTKAQVVYYHIAAPEIDCASEESMRDHVGAIKELVLDKAKVGNQRIFQVSGFRRRTIVRLDVAESILRRNSYGITFEKVRAEQGG